MELKMSPEVSPRNGSVPVAHFIEHGAKREQVGSGVEFFAPYLLRGHIGDGAQGAAGTREMFLGLDGRRTQSSAIRAGVNFASPKSRIFA